MRVGFHQPSHAKVTHLVSTIANQQHIVAGEVSVNDITRVEVGQSLGHVKGNVHLNMEGEGGRVFWSFQEAGQALVHQFHEENRQPGLRISASSEVLDYVRVSHFTEKPAFLLEALHDALGGGVPAREEDGV